MRDYAITILSIGLDADARLNDVSMFRERTGRRRADENFVNEYMAAGKNRLVLTVRPLGDRQEVEPRAQAVVELMAVERGQQIPEGELLAQVAWPAPDTPPAPRAYPQTVSVDVNVDAADHRGWRAASPIRLDEPTRTSVLALLRQLTEAMRVRDLDTVLNLLDAKVRERARAYGWIAAGKVADLRQNYSELMARPDWGVEEWRDEDAQWELMADNRLVRVTNPEGRPLIRSVDLGGIRLVIPSDVTYLKGRWTIQR